MIDMLKRHEVQVLRRAGHTWKEIAALSGVSVRTVRRIAAETAIATIDNAAELARRQVGRPSKADDYRDVLVQALTEEPTLRSVELLHRARQAGYTGGKSAIYALAQTLRVHVVTPLVRFEGLPGEFSQHDFGEVRVRYQDETEEIVHFFASRLKYSLRRRSPASHVPSDPRAAGVGVAAAQRGVVHVRLQPHRGAVPHQRFDVRRQPGDRAAHRGRGEPELDVGVFRPVERSGNRSVLRPTGSSIA
jgi:hypothetical protein